MFTTSESTAALDDALAKAQGSIEVAIKDSTNPHFRSKYADLASVWHACREALSKNNVSVTQWPYHSDDSRLHIVTRIAHKGEWMRADFSLPVQKQDAHGIASAVTYAKRIALTAAVGVAAEEDDDGNEASRPARNTEPAPMREITPVAQPVLLTAAESARLFDEGNAAASFGTAALQPYWGRLTQVQKLAVGGAPQIQKWKAIAKKADEANGPDESPFNDALVHEVAA